MSVMLARRESGRPRNLANSTAIIFAGGRGRGGDVDDRDVPARVRVAAPVHHLDGLAELGQAVVFPVLAGPDTIRPHRPAWACSVQLDQAAGRR